MSNSDGTEQSETMYLPAQPDGNGSPVAHTDRDCSRLSKARSVHQYAKDNVQNKRICEYCRGNVSTGGGTNDGPWQTLEEMSPDDLATNCARSLGPGTDQNDPNPDAGGGS
jgi:Icc-related predicted phosphoesterase